MTTRQKLQDRGINLNTILILASLISVTIGGIRLAGPILDGPKRAEVVESKVAEIQRTQVAQTENLRSLTELFRDFREIRRDVDRQGSTIESHSTRLDRLESRP